VSGLSTAMPRLTHSMCDKSRVLGSKRWRMSRPTLTLHGGLRTPAAAPPKARAAQVRLGARCTKPCRSAGTLHQTVPQRSPASTGASSRSTAPTRARPVGSTPAPGPAQIHSTARTLALSLCLTTAAPGPQRTRAANGRCRPPLGPCAAGAGPAHAAAHLPMTSVSSASQQRLAPTYALASILAMPKRLLNFVSVTFIICGAAARHVAPLLPGP